MHAAAASSRSPNRNRTYSSQRLQNKFCYVPIHPAPPHSPHRSHPTHPPHPLGPMGSQGDSMASYGGSMGRWGRRNFMVLNEKRIGLSWLLPTALAELASCQPPQLVYYLITIWSLLGIPMVHMDPLGIRCSIVGDHRGWVGPTGTSRSESIAIHRGLSGAYRLL